MCKKKKIRSTCTPVLGMQSTPRSTIGNGCGHRRRSVNLPPCLVLIGIHCHPSPGKMEKKKERKEREKKEESPFSSGIQSLSFLPALWGVSLTALCLRPKSQIGEEGRRGGEKRGVIEGEEVFCILYSIFYILYILLFNSQKKSKRRGNR